MVISRSENRTEVYRQVNPNIQEVTYLEFIPSQKHYAPIEPQEAQKLIDDGYEIMTTLPFGKGTVTKEVGYTLDEYLNIYKNN